MQHYGNVEEILVFDILIFFVVPMAPRENKMIVDGKEIWMTPLI
jgi:hypothetical protein